MIFKNLHCHNYFSRKFSAITNFLQKINNSSLGMKKIEMYLSEGPVYYANGCSAHELLHAAVVIVSSSSSELSALPQSGTMRTITDRQEGGCGFLRSHFWQLQGGNFGKTTSSEKRTLLTKKLFNFDNFNIFRVSLKLNFPVITKKLISILCERLPRRDRP